MKKTELKFYHGLALFALQIAIFIIVCVPLQLNLGMTGLALTELILICLAVIPALISGNSLKEVFPVKKVTLRQIFAVIILWLAVFLLNVVVNYTRWV